MRLWEYLVETFPRATIFVVGAPLGCGENRLGTSPQGVCYPILIECYTSVCGRAQDGSRTELLYFITTEYYTAVHGTAV